ncbi:RnfH family protein [Tepidicella baoligensis]|uniref:RnfH family protein n=1 Tax=Tepidicella baoligensis TaxID=2707016 RepID=UPI0015DAD223|nr:RnfH family protein [Tepidicella baoligensis]
MSVHVTVVASPGPRQVREAVLELPDGATVADALAATGWPADEWANREVGVWGLKATPSTPLREQDRVEIYRPLRVDPKVARKERFGRQGARTAGLFARRRPGSKPGY